MQLICEQKNFALPNERVSTAKKSPYNFSISRLLKPTKQHLKIRPMANRKKNTAPLLIAFIIVAIVILLLILKRCSTSTQLPGSDSSAAAASTLIPSDAIDQAAVAAANAGLTPDSDTTGQVAPSSGPTSDNHTTNDTSDKTGVKAGGAAPAIDPNKANNQQANLNGTRETLQGFMDAITQLDPVAAQQYVNENKVSYTTIAALCMVFEDGDYQLIKDRAIREMFKQQNSAGYLARLNKTSTSSKASFALNLKRTDAQADWKISEINLDSLLGHYAKEISGGDIHFSPLVKNPKGGESLAIYFTLDSDELTPRTQKQLEIVNNILKANPAKKLLISGHTDALGSDSYNFTLSEKRAEQVMNFLVAKGLDKNQVSISGFGKQRPRQPNTTADGADSPEGRRANRRAEILLNF